jgi:hypothetical protein
MQVVDGEYVGTVTVIKQDTEGVNNSIKLQVRDSLFADVTSPAVNENGALVFIDKDEPVVTIDTVGFNNSTYSLEEYNALENDKKWCNSITYNLNAEENYSYIDKVTAKDSVTGKETTLYEGTGKYAFTQNGISGEGLADGIHTMTYTATNHVSVAGSASLDVYIDKTAPEITINSQYMNKDITGSVDSSKEPYTYVVDSENGEQLSFGFSDVTSGIAEKKVTVNGSEVTLTDNSLSYTDTGVYNVTLWAKDTAGNETTKTFKVIIDNTEVETALSADMTKNSATETLDTTKTVYSNGDEIKVVYTAEGYALTAEDIRDNTTFTQAGSDTASKATNGNISVAAVDTAGQINRVTVTYTLNSKSEEGIYVFDFTAKNHYTESFLTNSDKVFNLIYDRTAPSVTTLSFENEEALVDGTYFYKKNTPTIYVEAEDNIALGKYEVKASSGEIITSADIANGSSLKEEIVLSDNIRDNELYTITFYAVDKAGNVKGEEFSQKFAVDKQAPTVTIGNTNANGNLNTYWNKTSVTLNASATDNYYVKSFEAEGTCDGKTIASQKSSVEAASSAATTFTYTASGVYKINVYAYDEVGNKSLAAACSFVIDTAGPGVTFTGIANDKLYDQTRLGVAIADNYGVSKDKVTVVLHYETYDGQSGASDITVTQSNSKNVSATIDSCPVIDDKPMKYYIAVEAVDNAGNKTTTNSAVFYYDATEPDIAINPDIAGKGTKYYNKTTTFNISITEQFPLGADVYVLNYSDYTKYDVSQYKKKAIKTYELTNSTTGSFNVSASKEGKYNWVVVAIDKAGNEADSDNFKFVIDKTAPEIEVDGIPENNMSQGTTVTFTIKDNYKINANDVSIEKHYTYYNGTKDYSVEMSVKTDKNKNLVATTTCNEVANRAVEYYFVITGHDYAGNKLTFETNKYKLKVDDTNPLVTISPAPVDTNDGYYNDKVSFNIKVKEQFSAKHKITITDKNKAANGDDDVTYTLKGTEGTYSVKRNSQGIYNLVVTVTDAFGNKTKKNVNFTIDKTNPVIRIASVSKTNNNNVSLNVNISDNYKGNEYTVHVVRKNPGGSVAYDNVFKKEKWETNSVTPDLVFTEEGDYTVTISADDKAGNKAQNDTVSFRIDKTAPVLTITGVEDMQTTDCTATLSVNEAFELSSDGNSADITATITKKTDGTAASNIATLNVGNFSSGNPHTATYSFNEDGEYTITLNAKDACGNTATPVTKTFKIDKTAPVLSVSAVDKKNSSVSDYQMVGGNNDDDNYVDMSISVVEAFYSTNNVSIAVNKDGQDVSKDYFTNYENRGSTSTGTQRFSEDGVYTVSIEAEDAVGNKAEGYSKVFTVDNTAPAIDATDTLTKFLDKEDANGDILLNGDDFQDILDKGYEALWNVNDTSVFNVNVKLDGVDFVDFSDLTDGYHKIEISATDEAGHTSAKEFEFTYDGTAPRILITGVEDKDTVRNPFTLTIGLEDEEDTITKIVINGKEIDSSLYSSTNSYEYQVAEYGEYEIMVMASDVAGNITSTYDSETGEIFSFVLKEKMSPVMIIIIILIILVLIALLAIVIIKRKKKDKE